MYTINDDQLLVIVNKIELDLNDHMQVIARGLSAWNHANPHPW